MGTTIKLLGTTSPLVNQLWQFKLFVEALDVTGANTIIDRLMFFFNDLCPPVLPSGIMKMGREKDHHIAITVGDFDGSLDRFEDRFQKFKTENEGKVETYEVEKPIEQAAVTSFRFIAAPAFRTYCVGMGLQGVSVDYALPKNHGEVPVLPSSNQPVKRMRYSHFACNVVHEDLAYAPGVDTHAAKMELKRVVDNGCHGKLPAGKFFTSFHSIVRFVLTHF
jgi:D-lactate dehydrogenase